MCSYLLNYVVFSVKWGFFDVFYEASRNYIGGTPAAAASGAGAYCDATDFNFFSCSNLRTSLAILSLFRCARVKRVLRRSLSLSTELSSFSVLYPGRFGLAPCENSYMFIYVFNPDRVKPVPQGPRLHREQELVHLVQQGPLLRLPQG